MDAVTDVTIMGVRTSHDIDVLVTLRHVGFDVRWIVECKLWKLPVSKLHVLALREIVADIGADRGILLSEAGFQSGAIEAANLTNVQVTSLAVLEGTARESVFAMRLRKLYERVDACEEAYWEISKDERIARGLRPDVGEGGYSGQFVIDLSHDVLSRATRSRFPIEIGDMAYLLPGLPRTFDNYETVVAVLEPLIDDLETRLARSGQAPPTHPPSSATE